MYTCDKNLLKKIYERFSHTRSISISRIDIDTDTDVSTQ